MSSSIRVEAWNDINTQILEQGGIILRKQDLLRAHKRLDEARREYDEARKDVLRQELARYYRVVIFGSAKLGKDDEEFKYVTNLAQALVEAMDVDIVTGGGPGIMEAGNLGVKLALGKSKGCKRLRARSHGITLDSLPNEQKPNGHLHFETRHREFPTRLQTFIDKTDAAFFAPGGIGTLCELALLLQTRQVGHIEEGYPLIAHPLWRPIVESWNNQFYYQRESQERTPLISSRDLGLIHFSDSIPDIVDTISGSYNSWRQNIRRYVRILP